MCLSSFEISNLISFRNAVCHLGAPIWRQAREAQCEILRDQRPSRRLAVPNMKFAFPPKTCSHTPMTGARTLRLSGQVYFIANETLRTCNVCPSNITYH